VTRRLPAALSPFWPLLFLLLVWAGQRFIGERWWVTTWTLYLPQAVLLIPSLLLMTLALLLRRWQALVGHTAVALLGVVLLFRGAYQLPWPHGRGDVRVMTWNVRALTIDPGGVLTTIQREAPDVLLLQEAIRDRGPDPIPWLERRLPEWHAVRAGDVAILSPHSLGPARPFRLGASASYRVALEAPVRVRGRRIDLISVHFSTALPRPLRERVWHHPRHNRQVAAAVRAEQTAYLAGVVRRARRPLVVGGDFNSPPGSLTYETLDDLLGSAFKAGGSGFGWTFPARRPLLRIDHLFVSDDLGVIHCWVLPVRASDHRPVIADLAWRR
jgi:vancomycin resistance protein VanJ